MIGVTEAKAKEIFLSLWSNDEYDWDFECQHFHDLCNRYGLDICNDAAYQLRKAREQDKQIRDEQQYFWGCARHLKDKESVKQSSHSRSGRDDGGITPQGFDSYQAYFDYLCRKIQEDFPDTPEQAERRRQEWETYQAAKIN